MTTPLDPSLSVRGAIIFALKADAGLTTLVPAERIYPAKTPSPATGLTWPFIRVGSLTATPVRLDCGAGANAAGLIHCFVKQDADNPDPEATASRINAEVARVIDELHSVALPEGSAMTVHVRLIQMLPDPAEADAFHGIVSYEAQAT